MALVSFGLIDSVTMGRGDVWFEPVRDACEAWQLNNEHRVAMFIANTLHESGRYRRLIESLAYSARRLLEVFPRYFTDDEAERMAGDEFAIGERVYGGRMGNGPPGSGDGFKFRGRGLIQITGRSNYLAISALVYDRDNPAAIFDDVDVFVMATWAAYASAAWWDTNGCQQAADDDDFEGVVRIIQTGSRHSTSRINGMAARLALLQEVQEAM